MSGGHVIQPPSDPLVGSVVAERYKVERRLGEGGMGAVYLAEHVVLEKTVALKVLHEDYSRRPDLVERFLHEAKAASRIRHEHVIDITDFGQTENGNVFFAMEFLEGRDLAHEIVAGGALSWPRALEVMRQLCSALQAAHDVGVVHRDLKPANIYLISRLERSDYVKVLDFGIAKLTDLEEAGQKLTRTGMVFGTPEYMSPEQARGDKPDRRVDVYAAGCILFELLTGTVPYQGDSFMGILTKHLFDPIPDLAARMAPGSVPAGLPAVLQRALAKDRNERFAEMSELAAALEGLGEPQPAAPPARAVTPTVKVGSHVEAKPVPVSLRAVALVLALAVVVGTVVFFVLRPKRDVPVPAATTPVVATDPKVNAPSSPPALKQDTPPTKAAAPPPAHAAPAPLSKALRKNVPVAPGLRPPSGSPETHPVAPPTVVTPPEEEPVESPPPDNSEIKDPFGAPAPK
jgi:serine/threonine-protein kinase